MGPDANDPYQTADSKDTVISNQYTTTADNLPARANTHRRRRCGHSDCDSRGRLMGPTVRTWDPMDSYDTADSNGEQTIAREKNPGALMRRTPLILTNNPPPLTTCWRTLRRMIAAVPADMQFVTGSEDPWAPVGKTGKLPVAQSNRPSLGRRTRDPRCERAAKLPMRWTALIPSSISLPSSTYRYALRHNDTAGFADIQFPARAAGL